MADSGVLPELALTVVHDLIENLRELGYVQKWSVYFPMSNELRVVIETAVTRSHLSR